MFNRRWSLLWCVLLLAACSRQPEGAAPTDGVQSPGSESPTDAAALDESLGALPGETAEVVQAESSLSIKRGIAKSAGSHSLFTPCDDKSELWVIDEGDDMLAQLFAAGMKTAYVEVYGERAPVPDDLQAASGYPGVFVLEQLLYAGKPAKGGGCAPAPADAVVTARGNEPFWAVEMTEAKANWRQQDPNLQASLETLQSQDVEGTVSYRAKSDAHQLELVIAFQPCRDLVSEEYFAFAARAKFDEKEFKGCARVGK